jgi:transglutaminase-like putative cysteine protease
MLVDQALRLTSILLAATGFVALVLGSSVPQWLAVPTAAALIHQLLCVIRFPRGEQLESIAVLSPATWNVLLVLGFVWFWVDVFWISGELLPAGIHFLLVIVVIKLFNLRARRDYSQLYAVSFMAFLASAALTAELWYVPIFVLYLSATVWSFLLFQIARDSDGILRAAGDPLPSQPVSGHVTRPIFWVTNGLAIATLCLAVAIFFALPRTSAGLFHSGLGDTLRMSGFSETVDLGAIGPIKRDPSVVMRVELPDRRPHDVDRLYLRGMAYDRYDGKAWMNRLTHRRVLNEPGPGTFSIRSRHPGPVSASSTEIHQKILLEALDTTVLFAAPFADTIYGPFPTVQSDAAGAIYLPFPSASRVEYSVISRPNPARDSAVLPREGIYSEAITRHFLQLPAGSERVAALARSVTNQASTPYERARVIQDHLSHQYRYALDIPPENAERPLEEFLFSRKTGYCEHYATAMVVMLRAVGIPARLVTGFLASEWNEYGNYYVVRQRDAHAWVETLLPGSGWVTMDPTPAVAEENLDGGWAAVAKMVDSLRLKWDRVFVQYTAADQLALVHTLRDGTASVKNQAWNSLTLALSAGVAAVVHVLQQKFEAHVPPMTAVLGLALLALLGAGAAAWLVWTRPWARLLRAHAVLAHRQRIGGLYQAMTVQLARRGIVKQPATTPFELLRSVRRVWAPAGNDVAIVTELYCRARFGGVALNRDELAHAETSLKVLKQLTRRRK